MPPLPPRSVVESLRRPALAGSAFILSFACHLMVCLAVAWLASALPEVPFALVVAAVSVTALTTLLPVTVSGLGVREAVFVMILGPAGVGTEEAVALGLLTNAAILVTLAALSAIPFDGGRLVGKVRQAVAAEKKSAAGA